MTDSLYTVGGAAVGAGVGGLVGQRASSNPLSPVVGAASGALVGGVGTALVLKSADQGRKNEFQRGYDLGASDTVKRQYWIQQELQKEEERVASPYRLRLYRIPIVPDPNAPVKTTPYDITLPVYE